MMTKAPAYCRQGMQGLHAQRRAHCDIKPQNIMAQLGPNGRVLHCTVHDLEGSVVHSGET